MPRGYWCIVIAAFAGLAVRAAPPSKGHVETAAGHEAGHTVKHAASISDEARYKPDPNKYDPACYYAENHDRADLCAQWRAALAAEKATDVAWWGDVAAFSGSGLSALSIFLLIWTLLLTQRANRIAARDYGKARLESRSAAKDAAAAIAEAKRAADAANAQVAVMRDTAAIELRAWLKVDATVSNVRIYNSQVWFYINLLIENTGKTPASDISIDIRPRTINFIQIDHVENGMPPPIITGPPADEREFFRPRLGENDGSSILPGRVTANGRPQSVHWSAFNPQSGGGVTSSQIEVDINVSYSCMSGEGSAGLLCILALTDEVGRAFEITGDTANGAPVRGMLTPPRKQWSY